MANKREHKRFIKRCRAEFTSFDRTYRGISSDFSLKGLFIRTTHPIGPGEILDIVVHFPDGSTSNLRGKVRRASRGMGGGTPAGKTPKNGMGIQLLKKDANYLRFLSTLLAERKKPSPARSGGATAGGAAASAKKPEPAATSKEILMALVSLLEKQGMLRKKELFEEIKRLRGK